jgi:hypothetical protein
VVLEGTETTTLLLRMETDEEVQAGQRAGGWALTHASFVNE